MKQSQRTRRISDLIAREMSSLLMTTRLEPNRLSEALHELPASEKIYLYCT